MLKMAFVEDIKTLCFPKMGNDDASLTAFQSPDKIPFIIKRVFSVVANQKTTRGFHAHHQCTQILVCLKGKCLVTFDDGSNRIEKILDDSSQGLLVPPSIWAEQQYDKNTVLMVINDMPYDENDYIRNYDDFLHFRKKAKI